MRRIWDRPQRLLHWALVLAVAAAGAVAWLPRWHEGAGLVALAAVGLRLAWGWRGGPYARFAQFVASPRATWYYARALRRGQERRYLGHNPLGGWMVLALLACVAGLSLTGWLFYTDAFWGDAALLGLHQALAWTLLALVVLHLAGVVFTSLRHRENLALAMLSGSKRGPAENDVV